jgi:hypothetical protein
MLYLARPKQSNSLRFLPTSIGFQSKAVANQIQNLKGNSAKDRIRTPLSLGRAVYQPCFGHITVVQLQKAHQHYTSAEKPLKECTGVFTTTTGLPCAHTSSLNTLLLACLPTCLPACPFTLLLFYPLPYFHCPD